MRASFTPEPAGGNPGELRAGTGAAVIAGAGGAGKAGAVARVVAAATRGSASGGYPGRTGAKPSIQRKSGLWALSGGRRQLYKIE